MGKKHKYDVVRVTANRSLSVRDFLQRSNDSGLSTQQSEPVAASSTSLSTSCVQTTIGACSNVSTKDVLSA